jgi:hypothetical protein
MKTAMPAAAAAALVFATAPAAEAAAPGKWTRVTPPGHALKDTDEIAIDHEIYGGLDLIWRHGKSIQHARLEKDLATVSGPHTVASYSSGVSGEVDLDVQGEQLNAFFAGLAPGSGVDSVLAMARSMTSGRSWTAPVGVSNASPAGRRPVYAAGGVAALIGLDTRTYSAWGSPGHGYHVGDPALPDGSLPGGASADAGIGMDGVSGHVVAAWNLLDEDGVAVMPIGPAGARTVIPGSGAAQVQTPVSVSGRIGKPGVYVAYTAGDNQFLGRPAIYRVGDARGTVLSSRRGARQTALAQSMSGRMWVFWHQGGKIHVRRSNQAMTAWGRPQTVAPPRGTVEINGVVGDDSLGSLDLVARLERDGVNAGWHTRVTPRLEIAARRTTSGKVELRVTDVGDPVAARVTVKGEGTQDTDGRDGRAGFRLDRGTYRVKATTPYGGRGATIVRIRR